MTRIFHFLAVAIIAAVAVAVSDREVFAQNGASNQPSADQVYVRDSAGAVEKFALAERMERLHEWGKAADVYQDVLTTYSDRVVPRKPMSPASQPTTEPSRASAEPSQYTSVVSAVQERLSHWPREGLDSYRARFETEARAKLEQIAPDDVAGLHDVYSNYFITDAGKSAGMKLIDLALERGDFSSAAWTAHRLLAIHPSLDADRPSVLFRAIVADHGDANNDGATTEFNELKNDNADALGRVRGQDVRLVDAAAQILAELPPESSSDSSASEHWTQAFGNAQRSKLGSAVASIGARLFAIDLPAQESAFGGSPTRAQLTGSNETARRAGQMTGVFPVVDGNEMFFQDNAFIYALNLDSGLPLSGWAQTYAGDRNGRYSVAKAIATPRSIQETVAISADSVFAVAGASDLMAMSNAGVQSLNTHETRLICLDRHNGRETYIVRPSSLKGAKVPVALKDLDFSGSPLLVDGRIYLTARGGKGPQFEDCYVVCLDAATGAFRWATYVASASAAGSNFDGDDTASTTSTLSHLAFASGRVFCLSNLGAVAAINAYDGSIAWLNLYARDNVEPPMNFARQMNAPPAGRAWAFNPIVVADGKVFSLPTDGKNLSIYDAADGRRLNRLPLKIRTVNRTAKQPYAVDADEPMQTIIGVRGHEVYLCGSRTVAVLDWTATDPIAMREGVVHQDSRLLSWFKRFDKGAGAPIGEPESGSGGASSGGQRLIGMGQQNSSSASTKTATIAGRPFLTDQYLFVPTQWRLECRTLNRGGTLKWSYPENDRNWSDGEEPGNILATSSHLIIAGPRRVSVYTDMNLAMKQLDDAEALAPRDPMPRLRYAEIMFLSGKADLALAKLDEAIALLGGLNSLPVGEGRQRVYLDSLAFAQKLAQRSAVPANNKSASTSRPASTVDAIDHLFDRAVASATTPSQQVGVRLARSEFARSQHDAGTELRLYHELLANTEWRTMQVARREPPAGSAASATLAMAGSLVPVAQYARQAVEEVLQNDDGRAAYQPYEDRAAKEIDAARSSLDPAATLELAQQYPNAKASRDAAAWAAEAYESAGNPRQAVQTFRQLYFRTTDPTDRLKILESMARNELLLPNRAGAAAARLAQIVKAGSGGKTLSLPMQLPNGRTLDVSTTIAQAFDEIHSLRMASMQNALPRLGLGKTSPFKSNVPQLIENVSSLYVPLSGFERNDRVVAGNDGVGIMAFAPGGTEPLFKSNAIVGHALGCAWTGGNLLIWDGTRLAMLDGEAGQNVWILEAGKLPDPQIVEAPADVAQPVVAQVSGDAASDDTATAIVVNGVVDNPVAILQQQQRRQIRMQRGRLQVAANGIFQVAAGLAQNDEATNGDVSASPASEVIVKVRPLSDRVIIATSTGRLFAVNLSDGKILWQSGVSNRSAGVGNFSESNVQQIDATDDFVAVRTDGDNFNPNNSAPSSKLEVFDATNGNLVFSQRFARESVESTLLNFALADDGLLVWVLPDRVVGKNLFEAGPAPRFGQAPLPGDEGKAPYADATAPDSLIVADGRILCLAVDAVEVREISPDTGAILQGVDHSPKRRATGFHPNEQEQASPSLRLVGSTLYAMTSTNLIAHDLNRDGESWSSHPDEAAKERFTNLLIGRDDLIIAGPSPGALQAVNVTDNQNAMNPQQQLQQMQQQLQQKAAAQHAASKHPHRTPAAELRMYVHSRQKVASGGEDGQIRFTEPFATKITAIPSTIQAVDGGVYFLTGDHKLAFLAGT